MRLEFLETAAAEGDGPLTSLDPRDQAGGPPHCDIIAVVATPIGLVGGSWRVRDSSSPADRAVRGPPRRTPDAL